MQGEKHFIWKRQLVVAIGTLAFVFLLYLLIPGYRWAVEEIGFRNLHLVNKIEEKRQRENLPPLNVHEKRAFKMEGYYYLQLLNSATPQDAVILLPPQHVTKGTRHEFLNSSEWVAYFVYPRLCIGYDERLKNPDLYARATHVAIVNGWGYEFLKYPVEKKDEEAVLPIQKQP
ncbi:MAG: hypothetical protein KF872_01290 [Chitinophagales bacterium]|nr:hypothetical protein [Chitinophagales bacterium]